MALQPPKDDPAFTCWLTVGWESDGLHGIVHPDEWKRLAIRGYVPIVIAINGFSTRALVREAGEFYKYIWEFDKSAAELGIVDIDDHEATFQVDWDRVIPAEFKEAAQHDPKFARLWNKLEFDSRCDLLKPIRRARSDAGRAKRAREAIVTLKLLGR